MTTALVVVGDVLLDVDTCGTARRFSPDGPVPVLDDSTDRRRPGGAGLVACLAAATTDRPVVLIAPFADDEHARTVRTLLPATVEVISLSWTGSTPVKNRVRADGHTVARVDRGGARGRVSPPPAGVAAVQEVLRGAAAVVVADYGYGATDADWLREALAAAAVRVPVVWDPHPRGGAPVAGSALVVPNEREALPDTAGADLDVLADRARALRRAWRVRDVAVTAGARGAVTTVGDGPVMVAPAVPVVADPCGAGDRFAVAVAHALADGHVPTDAVATAVRATGEFLAAGGLAAFAVGDAAPRRAVRVATGGCFDLLHAGHVATLEAARRLGDELVVCINSDASVRRLKGPERPLQPAADRLRIVEALACVDRAVVFEEDTPAQVLRTLRPDVWVKGGDYAGAVLAEQQVLDEWGGRAVTVPFLSGRSTTSLVGRATGRVGAAR